MLHGVLVLSQLLGRLLFELWQPGPELLHFFDGADDFRRTVLLALLIQILDSLGLCLEVLALVLTILKSIALLDVRVETGRQRRQDLRDLRQVLLQRLSFLHHRLLHVLLNGVENLSRHGSELLLQRVRLDQNGTLTHGLRRHLSNSTLELFHLLVSGLVGVHLNRVPLTASLPLVTNFLNLLKALVTFDDAPRLANIAS